MSIYSCNIGRYFNFTQDIVLSHKQIASHTTKEQSFRIYR